MSPTYVHALWLWAIGLEGDILAAITHVTHTRRGYF